MAITKIFAVRSRLDDSIKYATNAEKTSAEVLEGKIEYALNREKTEKQIYETALNCFSASTAYSEMQRTKEKWHKTGRCAWVSFHTIFQAQGGNAGNGSRNRCGVCPKMFRGAV